MRLLRIAVTSVAISLAAVGCCGVPEDTGPEVDPVDQAVARGSPRPPAPAPRCSCEVVIN